jgi:hypothetical protein
MCALTAAMKIFGLTAILAIAAAACTVESADVASDSDDVTSSSCKARFHWLQKDAYKSTAGHSSKLWPPHTTTFLEVVCKSHGKDVVVASAEMDNHGTKVGAKDAAGKVILVETKVSEVAGSKKNLLALVDAFKSCDCEHGTDFLSMETMNADLEDRLIYSVGYYLEDNLVCPNGTDGIVGDLYAGNIDGVLAALPACSWKSGKSLSAGLDEAMGSLAAETQEELADFHVCNNDAKLQAKLFADFAATGQVRACDAKGSAICRGPAWFYDPSAAPTSGK